MITLAAQYSSVRGVVVMACELNDCPCRNGCTVPDWPVEHLGARAINAATSSSAVKPSSSGVDVVDEPCGGGLHPTTRLT